jgi:quercetin dioxygenase-like cupin family protein
MTAPRGLHVGLAETPFPNGQSLTLHVLSWDAPGETGGHVHASWEVGVVLEGEVERRFEDSTFHLPPGGVWLHPGWEIHGWRHVSPTGRFLLVHFHPKFLSEVGLLEFRWRDLFIAPPRQRPLIAPKTVRDQVLMEASMLAEEVGRRPARWLDGVRLRLLLILLQLYQAWDHRSDWSASNGADQALARVAPALELVYSDLSHPVALADAAEAISTRSSAA